MVVKPAIRRRRDRGGGGGGGGGGGVGDGWTGAVGSAIDNALVRLLSVEIGGSIVSVAM
jgi:hypothetical protein